MFERTGMSYSMQAKYCVIVDISPEKKKEEMRKIKKSDTWSRKEYHSVYFPCCRHEFVFLSRERN